MLVVAVAVVVVGGVAAAAAAVVVAALLLLTMMINDGDGPSPHSVFRSYGYFDFSTKVGCTHSRQWHYVLMQFPLVRLFRHVLVPRHGIRRFVFQIQDINLLQVLAWPIFTRVLFARRYCQIVHPMGF